MNVQYSGRYDAIIVGVGGMGSATAYYLARRGRRVLGLERFGVPHAMGSSHGHTRIIRLAYYEDPSYGMAAQSRGAGIHGHERVLEWVPLEGGVRVRTDRGTYEADRLVMTAGAWNGDLLDVLGGIAVPERQVLAWLQPDRPDLFRPDTFPVFNLLVDEGRFYGFPVFSVPGFKFGKYFHLGETGEVDEIDRQPHDYDEQLLRSFAERYFPEGCGPTMDLQTCMFTNTPDHHFVIDLHPDYPQVSIASPCSGHGF